jgi:nicotinamide-nucleotide amidase
VDWTDVESRQQRVGAVHAAANALATATYGASWVARRRGDRRTGVALGHAGAAVATVGGLLGGHLAFTGADPRSGEAAPSDEDLDRAGAAVARAVAGTGRSIAVAESLTGGLLASTLARAEGSSEWFRGGVVSYASEVKHHVLGVPPGPVVSAASAAAMASGVAGLLGADIALAVTGVGGPEPQEGVPVGTVWIGLHRDGETTTVLHLFDDDPETTCRRTCIAAAQELVTRLREGGHRPPSPPS